MTVHAHPTAKVFDRLDALVAALHETVDLLSSADAAFAICVQETALSATVPAAAVALERLEQASLAVASAERRVARLLGLVHRLENRVERLIGAAAPLRTPKP